jgi:hypothetical protein
MYADLLLRICAHHSNRRYFFDRRESKRVWVHKKPLWLKNLIWTCHDYEPAMVEQEAVLEQKGGMP